MNWKVDALCADILTDLMLQRSSWNQNAAHFIPSLQMVYSSHILQQKQKRCFTKETLLTGQQM